VAAPAASNLNVARWREIRLSTSSVLGARTPPDAEAAGGGAAAAGVGPAAVATGTELAAAGVATPIPAISLPASSTATHSVTDGQEIAVRAASSIRVAVQSRR
jgi:hypothetical protein